MTVRTEKVEIDHAAALAAAKRCAAQGMAIISGNDEPEPARSASTSGQAGQEATMSDLQQTPVAPVTPETEKFPEVEIRNWPQAKMVFALGYWLTRVIKRSDTGKSRAKFIFYFRMNKAELVEIIKAYYSAEGLKVDCRDYDVGERPRPLSKARDEVRRVARRARLRSSL